MSHDAMSQKQAEPQNPTFNVHISTTPVTTHTCNLFDVPSTNLNPEFRSCMRAIPQQSQTTVCLTTPKPAGPTSSAY
eukprot:13644120-Ditylum_brightwellii.AAC.1